MKVADEEYTSVRNNHELGGVGEEHSQELLHDQCVLICSSLLVNDLYRKKQCKVLIQ